MAISVDTIYQRVLAVSNKEQRGYITPQEFNLIANQAQLAIFEQYFYDLDQHLRRPGNDTRHADTVTSLQEKIALFEVFGENLGNYISGYTLPTASHKISTVEYNEYECEAVRKKDFRLLKNSNILLPTDTNPIYTREGSKIKVYRGKSTTPYYQEETTNSTITIDYIKKPTEVSWGYVLDANNDALHNSGSSTNFDLHGSEEPSLVIKILELAGIAMKANDVYQVGDKENTEDIQQQKT